MPNKSVLFQKGIRKLMLAEAVFYKKSFAQLNALNKNCKIYKKNY